MDDELVGYRSIKRFTLVSYLEGCQRGIGRGSSHENAIGYVDMNDEDLFQRPVDQLGKAIVAIGLRGRWFPRSSAYWRETADKLVEEHGWQAMLAQEQPADVQALLDDARRVGMTPPSPVAADAKPIAIPVPEGAGLYTVTQIRVMTAHFEACLSLGILAGQSHEQVVDAVEEAVRTDGATAAEQFVLAVVLLSLNGGWFPERHQRLRACIDALIARHGTQALLVGMEHDDREELLSDLITLGVLPAR